MYTVYARGGGSSFILVRQILQTWTYMCGKQGLPTGFREHDVQVLLCIAQSACKAC